MDKEQISKLKQELGAELIETHISWVLLQKESVYKIKKPVKFSFLDFSTLERRRHFCEEEVRLNKRLSPEVYLGAVPVVEKNGMFSIGGEGRAIDYTVKMNRLPQEKRMDILLRQGKVTAEHIRRIAGIVADFHAGIDVIRDRKYGSWKVVKRQIDDLADHRETIENACGMGSEVDEIVGASDGFIEKNKALFSERQEQGMVRDCHGDLHSANIFIVDDKPIIFDCIEFSEDFRFIDVANEVAFMVMDLEAFEREDLARLFLEEYLAKTQDSRLKTVLDLYLCYRANVRAKIAAIDYSQHPADEAKERIRKYINLAKRYAMHL